MRRYIYIHGAPPQARMGAPGSRGCIRMRNADLLALFALAPVYTPVEIVEGAVSAEGMTEARQARSQSAG